MRRFVVPFCAACVIFAGLPAWAGDTRQPRQAGSAAGAVAVHFGEAFITSSNILDDTTQLSDTALQLRGTLASSVDTDFGTITLEGGFEATDYKTYRFANARALHVELRQRGESDGPLSLDTHLGYALSRGGDDIALAGIPLALRQTTQTFSAGGALKLKLPREMTAVLAVDESYDDVGNADFLAALPDTRINPDVNSASVSLGLARDIGGLHYGMTLKMANVALLRQTLLQNAVPYRSYALRGHLVLDDVAGWKLTGSLGLRRLDDGVGLYDHAMPVYKLIAARRIGDRYRVKASLVGDFDASDTDDPLATYRHQVELAAGAALGSRVALDLGAFAGTGENLVLGNGDKRWGAYGALSLKASPKLTLRARIQYTHTHRTVVDVDDSTLQARVGVRTAL